MNGELNGVAKAMDRVAMEEEIRDLRERIAFLEWQALSLSTFAKVMEHAKVVLFALDSTGKTTMSDGKGLQLLGLEPGERVGVNELDATRGTPAHDHLVRALDGHAVRAIVEPAPGVHFDTWYIPQRSEKNELDGVLGLAVDATDLVRKKALIEEQSATIRDLEAPVISVWHEVLCMPIIGSVDAARAAGMMQHLLEAIARDQARFAILDLTGARAMDAATVSHVVRIVAAARALGAVGVLSGVQPAVAQTIATLGIDLGGVRMMRTLRDALGWCVEQGSLRSKSPATPAGRRHPSPVPAGEGPPRGAS